jgi:DNA modification methylase
MLRTKHHLSDATALSKLSVLYQGRESLVFSSRNSRTHSKRQIQQIADSIRVFGFTNPILVDANNTIVAGHGRAEAAQLLGINEIPTICLEKLTDDQVRAYILADNRLAEKAGWDREMLAIELQYLISIDDDLDVTITGFEIPEIDLILEEASQASDPEDDLTETIGPSVTQCGDLWFLGKHRLLCGDALRKDSFATLMGHRRADVVFTDPPYNVRIDGHASGNGSVHHREFAMAAGEMSEAEFVAFLTTSLGLLAHHSKNGAVNYICMDWRHTRELGTVGAQIYDSLLNVCIWVKDNGGMGSFYRSQHEMVFVYRSGKESHRNNIQLGKFGRNRTNVWRYPGANSASRRGDEGNLLALHPTVKPLALVADALLDCSARGDLVLDSFLGSGTTLMAAERVGRVCYGMEFDPGYVDVAIRRWQQLTGEFATHAVTGETFAAIAEQSEVPIG